MVRWCGPEDKKPKYLKENKPSRIEMAPCDKVDKLKEYIDELLYLLGHPEALVTDRSSLWDFFGSETGREQAEELSSRLGFKVHKNTILVDIAEEMKKNRE